MKRICIVTTVWSSINNWVKPFLNEYNNRGIDVTVVSNMDDDYQKKLHEEFPFVKSYSIDFPRGISVFGSISSIHRLTKFLKNNEFDLIQYSTPNASMYAAVASKLAKVPVRLYCQWGMVYVTMAGIKRKIFRAIEKLVCKLSTEIQPDSTGNLEFCRKNGLYDSSKSRVIWNGSAKGLDLSAFDISNKEIYSKEIKNKYEIQKDDIVIGFVGRLGKEKGCNELFRAFQKVKKQFKNTKLLFVGPIEKEESIEPELLEYFNSCPDIIITDRVTNVEKYISAMDVFVLPSHREGFGMGVIEASAMEVPVVVTKYPGPSSAMKENVTGFSVEVKDVESLTERIIYLLSNPEEAKSLGKNGRKYVEEHFEQKEFIKRHMENRLELLGLN